MAINGKMDVNTFAEDLCNVLELRAGREPIDTSSEKDKLAV